MSDYPAMFPHKPILGHERNREDDRVAVTVKSFANSDLNGEAPAYLYRPEAAEMGLDPWRLIEGVDRSTIGESFEIWGVADWARKVGPNFVIYVSRAHARKIGVEALYA